MFSGERNKLAILGVAKIALILVHQQIDKIAKEFILVCANKIALFMFQDYSVGKIDISSYIFIFQLKIYIFFQIKW